MRRGGARNALAGSMLHGAPFDPDATAQGDARASNGGYAYARLQERRDVLAQRAATIQFGLPVNRPRASRRCKQRQRGYREKRQLHGGGRCAWRSLQRSDHQLANRPLPGGAHTVFGGRHSGKMIHRCMIDVISVSNAFCSTSSRWLPGGNLSAAANSIALSVHKRSSDDFVDTL